MIMELTFSLFQFASILYFNQYLKFNQSGTHGRVIYKILKFNVVTEEKRCISLGNTPVWIYAE